MAAPGKFCKGLSGMDLLKRSHHWEHYRPFNVRTATDIINRDQPITENRVAQLLGLMVLSEEVTRLRANCYVRHSSSRKWLTMSWRTASDDALGIQAHCPLAGQ